MRIALFDWAHGGHHPVYIRRFAETLAPIADVVVAASDPTLEHLDGLEAQTIALGSARPPIGGPLRLSDRGTMRREARLLERIEREAKADHILHLHADAILPRLALHRTINTPISVLLFYPRAHYPQAFDTPLSRAEHAKAVAKEAVVAAWRRRRDAHALMTLDEEAARRWRERPGAPASWIPEPPVPRLEDPESPAERVGCVLYGALAERKGIDLLADAVALDQKPLHLTIAGEPSAAFLPTLELHVAEMRRSGASVDLRPHRHGELEGLRVLASGRCAVLPYPRHDGMSRVLVEACSVGTPVIVHARGLLGYLVRRYGLGLAVNCTDPHALRGAIFELSGGRDMTAAYSDALTRFASRFSAERFHAAVTAPFAAARASRAVNAT